MNQIQNFRAAIFEDLLTLKGDLEKGAKRFKKSCPWTVKLFRLSAKRLGRIINYRTDDKTVKAILEEIGNALALHGATAIFLEARIESIAFSKRVFGLLPKGSVIQLKLLFPN
jgi:hypothetical protein